MKLFALTITYFDSGRFERHDLVSIHDSLESAKFRAGNDHLECFSYLYGEDETPQLVWHGPSESDRKVVCWCQSSSDGDRVVWTVEETELNA